MDYRVYRLSRGEEVRFIIVYTAAACLIAYTFYDSPYALFFLLPVGVFIRRRYKEELKQRRSAGLRRQFQDMIDALSTALSAGASVENSFREAYGDMVRLYGREGLIVRELEFLLNKMAAGINTESVLKDFAIRADVTDITDFSEIFSLAVRSGGNMNRIIGNTVRMMKEKDETEREISVILSGRRYEQRLMCLIPFGIILYLRFSGKGFLNPLYHSIPGAIIMTGCLLMYAVSCMVSGRIADIKV